MGDGILHPDRQPTSHFILYSAPRWPRPKPRTATTHQRPSYAPGLPLPTTHPQPLLNIWRQPRHIRIADPVVSKAPIPARHRHQHLRPNPSPRLRRQPKGLRQRNQSPSVRPVTRSTKVQHMLAPRRLIRRQIMGRRQPPALATEQQGKIVQLQVFAPGAWRSTTTQSARRGKSRHREGEKPLSTKGESCYNIISEQWHGIKSEQEHEHRGEALGKTGWIS